LPSSSRNRVRQPRCHAARPYPTTAAEVEFQLPRVLPARSGEHGFGDPGAQATPPNSTTRDNRAYGMLSRLWLDWTVDEAWEMQRWRYDRGLFHLAASAGFESVDNARHALTIVTNVRRFATLRLTCGHPGCFGSILWTAMPAGEQRSEFSSVMTLARLDKGPIGNAFHQYREDLAQGNRI